MEGNFKTKTKTPTTVAQDVMVREKEGTGVMLIFKNGTVVGQCGTHLPAPDTIRTSISQDSGNSLVRAPTVSSSALLMKELKKHLHLNNGWNSLPEPGTCSLFVQDVDGNKDVFLKYSVPSISPNI